MVSAGDGTGSSQNRLAGNRGLPAKRNGERPSTREDGEVASACVRLIRSLGRRVADGDPDGLEHLLLIEQATSDAWGVAVDGLRASGYIDAAIGAQLGVTRQAVQARWPR
jgi:hypothetical protein